MADNTEQTPGPGTVSQAKIAERVLDNLAELEPELRAAAILGPDGESIGRTRDAAMTNVASIASDTAVAIVERLTGKAPTGAEAAAAVKGAA